MFQKHGKNVKKSLYINFRLLDAKMVVLTVGFDAIEKIKKKMFINTYLAIGFEVMCQKHGKNTETIVI